MRAAAEGRVNVLRVTERVYKNISQHVMYVYIKIAVSYYSSVEPPGSKAAISPKWNGLSASNFEQAQLKDK